MLTIAAAMRVEIRIPLELCASVERLPVKGVAAWQAQRNGVKVHLLRTGMGPSRAALQFGKYVAVHMPSRILLLGFGGALDPSLRPGDLVVVRRTVLLGSTRPPATPLEEMKAEHSWTLHDSESLVRVAAGAGIRAVAADAVSVPFIVGDPAQKRALHRRLGAAVIDMESAAIAAAAPAGIAVSCIRAVSDEAAADFLAPFSYAPGCGPAGRAVKVAAAGEWLRRYRSWRECSAAAARTLERFLTAYLESDLARTEVSPLPRSG